MDEGRVERERAVSISRELSVREREVARLEVLGLRVGEIAAQVGLSEGYVHAILNDARVVEFCGWLRSQVEVGFAEARQGIVEGLRTGLSKLKEKLDNDELTVGEMLKLVEFYADREPSGEFQKKSKTTRETVGVFDGAEMRMLQERGRALGLTEYRGRYLDGDGEVDLREQRAVEEVFDERDEGSGVGSGE